MLREKFNFLKKILKESQKDEVYNISKALNISQKKIKLEGNTINIDGDFILIIDIGNVNHHQYISIRDYLNKIGLENYRFGSIAGSFSVISKFERKRSFVSLKNLEGSPDEVSRNFEVVNMGLQSMVGLPKRIGGFLVLKNNEIENFKGLERLTNHPKLINLSNNLIKNFKDFPFKKQFKGSINLSKNALTSLEGAPERVMGNFFVSDNQLETLKGCPKYIYGNFNASYNKISDMVFPKLVKGNFEIKGNPAKFKESQVRLLTNIEGFFVGD